jgi:hypothetical protein
MARILTPNLTRLEHPVTLTLVALRVLITVISVDLLILLPQPLLGNAFAIEFFADSGVLRLNHPAS